MRFRASKLAQKAIIIAFCLCYTTLLFVWLTSTAQEADPQLVVSVDRSENYHQNVGHNSRVGYQERAPRSVSDHKNNVQNISTINSNKSNIFSELSNDLDSNNLNSERLLNNKNNSLKQKFAKTSLNDIFISVKTTKKFHSTRLDVILKSWFPLAKEQTFFFTDADDKYYNEKSGGHLINTNCSSSHNRRALCCKMSVEFDTFIESNKRWFCHFDDDNYVNVPQLVRVLDSYNPLDDWYLGKPSIRQPLEIVSRHNKEQKVSFWFATGGAGFCLSRAIALRMVPMASGGKFITIGESIRLPDDVTIGYIVEHLLSTPLTVIDRLHSHLEPNKSLKRHDLSQQISFSFSQFDHSLDTLPPN